MRRAKSRSSGRSGIALDGVREPNVGWCVLKVPCQTDIGFVAEPEIAERKAKDYSIAQRRAVLLVVVPSLYLASSAQEQCYIWSWITWKRG